MNSSIPKFLLYRGLVLSDSTFLKFRKFWSKISDYGLEILQNFGHISDSTPIFLQCNYFSWSPILTKQKFSSGRYWPDSSRNAFRWGVGAKLSVFRQWLLNRNWPEKLKPQFFPRSNTIKMFLQSWVFIMNPKFGIIPGNWTSFLVVVKLQKLEHRGPNTFKVGPLIPALVLWK